jgi:hypothetical protein
MRRMKNGFQAVLAASQLLSSLRPDSLMCGRSVVSSVAAVMLHTNARPIQCGIAILNRSAHGAAPSQRRNCFSGRRIKPHNHVWGKPLSISGGQGLHEFFADDRP